MTLIVSFQQILFSFQRFRTSGSVQKKEPFVRRRAGISDTIPHYTSEVVHFNKASRRVSDSILRVVYRMNGYVDGDGFLG